MRSRDCTLPELDRVLDALAEGALHQITRRDYERLFGTNSAALGRLRNFAKSHSCVASFADEAVLFRRRSKVPGIAAKVNAAPASENDAP